MAAGATELATAYLSLVPSLRGAADAINRQLGGVDVSKSGASMGGQLAKSIGPTFGSKVASSLSSLSTHAASAASKAATAVTTSISGSSGWQLVAGLGAKYLNPIAQTAVSVAAKGSSAFTGFATSAGSLFSTLFGKLPPVAQTALTAVGGAVGTLGSKIGTTLSPVISSIGTKLGGIPGAVGSAFSSIPNVVGSSIDAVGGVFSRGAGAIKSMASSLGKHIKGALTSAMAVGGAAVVAGMGMITSQIGNAVSRADTLHNFPKIMKNLGYSADDAAKSVKTMSDRLIGLPTTLDSMTGMAQKLAPLTGNLQQATDVSLALNDALLAGGKSTQLQSNAMEQYAQMLSVGKVDMMAWRSMVDAMPGQMDQLAKSLLGANANQMDLYNAMKSGKVTFSDFNNAVMNLDKNGVNGFASFSQQAKDATNGISTQWTNLKTAIGRGLAGLLDAVGYTRITGAMSGITKAVNGAFNSINSTVGPIFNSISAKMHELSSVFNGGQFNGIKSIIAPIAAVGAAVGAGGLAGAFEKLGKTIPALAGPLGKLGGPLNALGGPFGIVLAAVGALIAQSPQLQATLGGTMKSAFSALGSAVNACKPAFDGFVAVLNNALASAMPAIISVFNSIIPLFNAAISAWAPLIPAVLTPLMNVISALIPPLTSIITSILPPIASLLSALNPPLTQIVGVIVQVAGIIMSALMPVIQQIAPVISSIVGIVASLITSLTPIIAEIVTSVAVMVGAATPLIHGLVDVFAWLVSQVVSFIQGVIVPTIQGMLPVVQSVISTISGIIRGIAQVVRGVVNIVAGIFTGDWARVWNGLGGVVKGAVDIVKSYVGGFIDIGKNMIKGLWNGIESTGAWIWSKISGFCNGIVDKVKGLFGIHSPSRVFREEIGVMLGRGLALGIDDSSPMVEKRVMALSNVINSGLAVGSGKVTVPATGLGSAAPVVQQDIHVENHGIQDVYTQGTILGRTLASSARQSIRARGMV